MPMAERRRIPFTVVGGFLGAGKTTLVNHLLRGAAGQRLAVLVNDFGAVNIDAALIGSKSADTIALTNGCVCCQIGDDFMLALVKVLAAPEPFDAIVVEASGVSDPWRIAQIGRADPALSSEGIVVVADAAALLAQAEDPLLADTLMRQLRSADFVLLNKIDLVDAGVRARVRAWVEAACAPATVFETTQARPPAILFAGDVAAPSRKARSPARSLHDAHAASHGSDFESCVFAPGRPLSAGRLRALLAAMPAGVLRLKGLVPTDEHGWAELQFAGRRGSLRSALAAPADGAGSVVAIALRGRLPRSELAAAIAAAECDGATACPMPSPFASRATHR